MRDSPERSPAPRSAGSVSTSLIQGLKACDEAAWQRLLDLYAPLLFSWCRQSELQAQDAADVVQEVFRAVSQAIAGFRRSRPTDTFRGWLRTICRNKIRDHFRARAGQPVATGGSEAQLRFLEVAADESVASVECDPYAGLLHRGLSIIRDEFEERTWRAFWASTVEERDSREVARQVGMTPGAVRQAKYKVLRRLRQELGDAE